MLNTYRQAIETRGFVVVPGVLDSQDIGSILAQLKNIPPSVATKQRGRSYFGIRNLLEVVPALRELANSPAIRALVDPIAGPQAQVVRGIFFDKTPEANWKVPWHQDLTIAVRERKEIAGFSGWSVKSGITHVQPPDAILKEVLTLRLHLDATDEDTGALKVVPGSHSGGRLSAGDIQKARQETKAVICSVAAGDVLAMRPLLLHASSVSSDASPVSHRRVIHLEFCSADLPGGLQWHLA